MNASGGSSRRDNGELIPTSCPTNPLVLEMAITELVHETETSDPVDIVQKSESVDDGSAIAVDNQLGMVQDDAAPRKEAWIQSMESAADLRSSIFEFVPLAADSIKADSTDIENHEHHPAVSIPDPVASSPDTPETISRPIKRVHFAPGTMDATALAHDHNFSTDALADRTRFLSVVEQNRQVERSYIVPDDLPSFGWWDCFQLGLSLTYTTICLRRSISPRCLVFNDQQELQAHGHSSITAKQLSVLARAGLAFNRSTEALTIRQGRPPPPPKPVQRKAKRRREFDRCARLGFTRIVTRLRHRKRPTSKPMYEDAAKLSSRVNETNLTKLKRTRLHVRLNVKLRLRVKVNEKKARDEVDHFEAVSMKRFTKGSDKNKIGAFGAIAVFRALRVNCALVSLCLEYVAIDDSAISALAAALRVNTALTHLSLAGNRISAVGARDLADALEDSPDSVLIDLNLADNRLGSQGVEELGRALRENETLTRCDCSWNQIGPQAVLSLLSALRDNFVFRELCVYGRDLAQGGTQYLSNLDFDSAKQIIVALRHVNDSFAVARLSSARAILPIDKMKASRWVNLANRELEELDGLVVAGLIPQNTMLLSLDLHDNPRLGRAAVLELLAAIKHCPMLQSVDLSNTGLFPESGESVGELVGLNNTLETIKMHETIISVQQVRGNPRRGHIPEKMVFSIDPKHFLDCWILAKCFAVNHLTQELNELRLPVAPSSVRKAAIVDLAANPKEDHDLISFNQSGRRLELYEVAFLGKKMLHHLHLGRVAFNSCVLDSGSARALADGIRNHATLHTLELENNPLGPIGGQALAECLASSSALTHLNLSWTQLGDDGVMGFRDALTRNKSIERLDLRGNELRVRGILAIAQGLRHTATLRELHLRWNTVSPIGAEALALALEINTSLILLDIEHHTMGPRGAAAFASMLARNKHLELLNMAGTDSDDALDTASGIGSEQTRRIADVLKDSNRTLQVLHIGANCIDAEATACFGELLRFNATLVALDLSRSGLDGKKAPRFFACLSMNSTLKRLNLAHNHIANEGLVACIRALETNRTLRELNLAHNGISEEPLAVLVAKLHSPKRKITSSLEWLCLTGNKMTERTRREYQALPQNLIAIELREEREGDDC